MIPSTTGALFLNPLGSLGTMANGRSDFNSLIFSNGMVISPATSLSNLILVPVEFSSFPVI